MEVASSLRLTFSAIVFILDHFFYDANKRMEQAILGFYEYTPCPIDSYAFSRICVDFTESHTTIVYIILYFLQAYNSVQVSYQSFMWK